MEQLTVKKLTPELLEDYLYFFEHVAHTDNPEWDRCYCLNYCGTNNQAQEQEFRDPDVRRDHAVQYVRSGILQGYLAYLNGKAAGWCNANDRNACMECAGMKYLIAPDGELQGEEEKGKAIFCFTVAPDLRGKGVATALLGRVVTDAKEAGYAYVEAYPNKEQADQYYSYVGPIGLYRKLGFEPYTETKWRLVLRKYL